MKKKNNVFIIGSSFSGLASAITLAKSGKIVTVLEKSSTPGGDLRCFKEGNWNFNIGFNYISNMDDEEHSLLNKLTGNRITFRKIDEAYESLFFKDGSKYEIISNKEKFLSRLKNDFPTEIVGLVEFFKDLDYIIDNRSAIISPKIKSGIFHFLSKVSSSSKFSNFDNTTLQDLLTKYIKNPKLKTILSLHCEKILLAPNDVSFKTFSLIKNRYFNGGTYPVGNIDAITSALVEELELAGGQIKYNTEVKNITINRGRATGVKLIDNSELLADTVISSVGILDTYEKFIENHQEYKKYQQISKILKPNRSNITLYIGLEGDIKDLNIGSSTYRVLGKNPFYFNNDPTKSNYSPEFVSITFPTIKESGTLERDYNTCQIHTTINNEYFSDFDRHTILDIEKDLETKLLSILEQQFPGLGKHISFTKISTPVKDEFNNYREDLKVGIPSNIEKLNDSILHPYSGIKNLYFTAINPLSEGVVDSCFDGIITSSNVVNKNLVKILC